MRKPRGIPHTLGSLKESGKVTYEGECWIWHGALCGGKADPSKLYGSTTWEGRTIMVHQLVFLLTPGHRAIPQAAHSCGHSRCFNPDHIYEATQTENEADKIHHGGHYESNRTHCPRNHPYAGDNLYVTPSTGKRICRACIPIRKQERKSRMVGR